MSSQFTPKVSEILSFSREEASRLASRSVGPEHLLLALMRMKEGPVINVFQRLDINMKTVKTELEERVRQEELGTPITTSELVLNEKASNILKLAVLEARLQHSQRVDEQHLLLAILHDQTENGAKDILEHNNMNYEDALTLLSVKKDNVTSGLGLPEEDYEEEEEAGAASNNASNGGLRSKTHELMPHLQGHNHTSKKQGQRNNRDGTKKIRHTA